MFCENCGREVKDDDMFCPNCGQPIQTEQTSNNLDETIENKKNVHEPKKRKSKKILLIIGIILAVIAFILFAANSQAKDTLKKLQKYTTVSKVKDGYEFVSDNSWTLCYTKDSETVRIENSDIKGTLEFLLGLEDLGRNGDVYYNLDSEEMHINCETPYGDRKLTSVVYDTKEDSFRFMLDLEWYEPTGTVVELFEEYELGEIFQSKIVSLMEDLKEMDLTKDDVANLTYKDIKANVDDKELKTVKKDKESKVPEQEETKPEPEVETEPEEEPVKEVQEESSESNEKENVLTDPITMGWAGTYKDDDSGERLVIASIGYEWSYVMYTASGQVEQKESGCSAGKDYLEGQYYTFYKNENGLLGVTSGVGGGWGNYRRISGTYSPDLQIEGTYENDTTTITVSEQMAEASTEYVPTGADIAAIHVKYNNGLEIDGRLYTQGDGGLAIVDSISKEIYGTATFKNNQVEVTGSGFDGILKSK